ncbi:thioredoxin [Acanthocystis turfacea Chlorella virus NE-JV-2]|nr:thioredoxin [Acanthocystis turfacea Chlorella virus NE-JV-2]
MFYVVGYFISTAFVDINVYRQKRIIMWKHFVRSRHDFAIMQTIKVNSVRQFTTGVATGRKYALAKFYKDGCKPCGALNEKYIKPRKNLDIDLYEVEHVNNKVISRQYNVRVLPTVVLFENGEPVGRAEGLKAAEEFFENVDSLNFVV